MPRLIRSVRAWMSRALPLPVRQAVRKLRPGARAPAYRAIEVRRLPGAQRSVLLTFDAGADHGATGEILDLLAVEGIPAAFGLTAQWSEAAPDLVRRIARDGHGIINHSDDNTSFTGFSTGAPPLDRAARLAQLERTDAVVRDLTGSGSRPWFRPPYGDLDPSVLDDVGRAGWHRVMMWTVDSFGWKGLSAEEITARCLERAEPGAIYLFHVGSMSRDGEALPALVAGLRAAGYGFAPLDAITAPTD